MSSLLGKRRWWIVVLIVLVGIALVEFLARPKPLPVVVQQVERGEVEAIVANTRAGTVKACRRAHLAPQGGGQIAMLQAHVGDRVEAGQVLLTLWNDDLKAQVRLAQAEQKAAVATAEQSCLKAEESQRDARRQKTLMDKGQISEEAYDRAVTGAKAGQASCTAARAQVGIAESRIDVAAAALERTLLKAPFPGYIAEVNGEVGEYATPSPPGIPTLPAIDLVDTSCLYISAPIDEVDAPSIRTGMLARITLDAVPNHHFLGAVDRIAPYVQEQEKQARTVEVEALFANPDEYKDLIPGYSADLEIIVKQRKDVLRIPTEAVMEGGRVLIYPASGGVLEERKIETGLTNWQYTEVVSGLTAAERVVVSVERPGVEAGVLAEPETPTTER